MLFVYREVPIDEEQTLKHQGPAREFDSEEEATKAIMAGRIRKGEVGD
ncbi:MAG: hypothetical protein HGA50_08400 [Deltaproteobacteria bacterium]|nr:hypothetical protein [Deltaproteobacteria bacterium]